MSNLTITNAIENALIKGDLSGLTPDQRLNYLKQVCDTVGLNYLTKPFEYIQLNGKLTLYATRAATDQLRSVHKVSIKITAREKFDDIYIVTAQATNADGRFDESTGAVNVTGLKGEALANAYLKAETKAKRRVTLSLCGLGLLDESEVATISDAKPAQEPVSQIQEPKKHIVEKVADVAAQAILEPIDFGSYVINFGKKMAGKKLTDFHVDDHVGMLTWLDDQVKKNGKPLSDKAKDYYDVANAYVNSILGDPPPKQDDEEVLPF